MMVEEIGLEESFRKPTCCFDGIFYISNQTGKLEKYASTNLIPYYIHKGNLILKKFNISFACIVEYLFKN